MSLLRVKEEEEHVFGLNIHEAHENKQIKFSHVNSDK